MLNANNLIWVDMEMTGLNPDNDRIIEIAVLVTSPNLSILAEGPVIAIYQSDEVLKLMDRWNLRTHTSSGLLNKVRSSKFNENRAAKSILSFLKIWVPAKKSPICGNSICQDRRFLFRYMPKLESYFHYRCIDVSSIKELISRWRPEILSGFQKKNSHQALNDIYESVNELIYYRKYFMQF